MIIAMIAMTTPLISCSIFTPEIKVIVDSTCEWFEDQQITEETRAWIRSSKPPAYVIADLKRISENTQLSIDKCPHITRRN